MNGYSQINVLGTIGATGALLCWGSTKGVCSEVAVELGLRMVQPVVLSPFPVAQLKKALEGTKMLICVEENATAQLATLSKQHGIIADKKILRYDGRPFTYESLLAKVREAVS
jgi:2-oxoglutarate ferredoxin oxidoreductase subunit alpha